MIDRPNRLQLRQFSRHILHARLAEIGKLVRIKALYFLGSACRQEQVSSCVPASFRSIVTTVIDTAAIITAPWAIRLVMNG